MSLQSNQPTILAVDDSTVMQEIIKEAIANDFNVLVANSAVDALSLIYHQPIALFLLDISLPGVDGLDLCRTLRTLPQCCDLPIIMLTARDKVFDKVQGHLAGATAYLTKPFEAEQLRAYCRKLMNFQNSESST